MSTMNITIMICISLAVIIEIIIKIMAYRELKKIDGWVEVPIIKDEDKQKNIVTVEKK